MAGNTRGLSLATGVDGALHGAEVMSGLINQQQGRSLRDAQEQRTAENHELTKERIQRQRTLEDAQEKRDSEYHDSRMRNSDQLYASREQQMVDNKLRSQWDKEDRKTTKIEQAEAKAKLSEQEQTAKFVINAALHNNLIAAEDVPEQMRPYLQDVDLTSPDKLFSPEMDAAVAAGDRLLQGLDRLDTSGPIDLNKSPGLKAIFEQYDPTLLTGNADGKKVSPSMAYIDEGPDGELGFYLGLSVEDEDGIKGLTVNRTSKDDDPIRFIPLKAVTGTHFAIKKARDFVRTPEAVNAMAQQMGLVPKSQASIENLPAKAQMIEYYIASGYSKADAIRMANSSVASREKFAQDYSKMILESSKDTLGRLSVEPSTALQQALDVYDQHFRREPQSNQEINNSKATASPESQAPAAAIEALRANPALTDQFKAKYGYIPSDL